MADYITNLYTPPKSYQDAHAGADEAGDIRYLHASAAVIRIGGVPVVAVENLNISQQINRSPIYVVGAIAPLGFDVQGVSVNVSGQLVQLAVMSLNQSPFYPANEAEVIANINRTFNIDIVMVDNKADPLENLTEPIITVLNCQNTGSNITINPNTNMKDSFTAVGTFMVRNWDALADFNKLAA
jgi:hypothetical protein